MPVSAMLVDRDGTLILETPRSARRAEEVRLIASTLDALAGLPVRLLCVTNQSVIGRGEVSAEAVEAVNTRVAALCAERGVHLEGFLVCPHAPWDGCRCRKPLPGLVERAVEEYGVDPGTSWVVGNRLLDAEMGAAAGCAGTVLVRNPPLEAELREHEAPAGTLVVTRRALARTLQSILEG